MGRPIGMTAPDTPLQSAGLFLENELEGDAFPASGRGTKPYSEADETTLKQRAGYPHDLKQAGDGQNAVHF
jgi:hypothetical protein